MKNTTKPVHSRSVYGHHLPAPRPTPWVPLLLTVALSLPVLVLTALSLLV